MAGKQLFPTEGSAGGIQAGSPFTLNQFVKVESVTPPFINSGRLGQLLDPGESIVAPGTFGSAHSFIMGEGSTGSANGARALVIGYAIQQNNSGGAHQADDQTLLGNTITVPLASPNSQGITAIGSSIAFQVATGHNSFGGTVAIGFGMQINCLATTDALNSVAIGPSVILAGSAAVAIGSAAQTTNDEAVAIGKVATANLQAVAIGSGTSAGAQDVVIGHLAKGGTDSLAMGAFATCVGQQYNIAIGSAADASGSSDQLIIGGGPSGGSLPVAGFPNAIIIGRNAPRGYTTLVWGQGVNTSVGGVNFLMRTTDLFGGSGNNLPGMGWTFQCGNGTGNWPNTAENLGFDFQVGIPVASGSNRQTYTSAFAIRQSDRNIAICGGLTAPFSSGIGVVFMANAGTNPTVAAVAGGGILSVQGGELHWLSSSGVDTALTPGGGGGGGWTIVSKKNDQLSAAPGTVNDNTLVTPSLNPGKYRVQVNVFAGAVGAGGFQFGLTVPTNTFLRWHGQKQDPGSGTLASTGNVGTGAPAYSNANSGEGWLYFDMIIVVSVAGPVQLTFNSQNAGNTLTVYAGSYLQYAQD